MIPPVLIVTGGGRAALVNNAARLELQMRVESMDAARLQRMFATNVIGPILCAREAVRHMSVRHGGEPNRVDRVKSLVPMQGGGRPEEVAAAILWLLSPEASYVTGTFINVAGGR